MASFSQAFEIFSQPANTVSQPSSFVRAVSSDTLSVGAYVSTPHSLRKSFTACEAFAALPAGTVENLLKPENKDQLIAVLTYHVVPGKVMAADIAGKTTDAATVQGANIAIDATDGVKINDASVVAADVEASNGVIHVIDKVILPPS